MYKRPHVKYPLFLSQFKETRIFLAGFRKVNIKFHEIRQLGTELFHEERRRTDRHD